MPEIDRFLPEWDVNEVHALVVSARPERALAAALAANCAPGPARPLLRLRGLRFAGSIEELFERLGFDILAREPHEVVVGGSGAPWRPRGGMAAFEQRRPGTVRIAANFLAEPLDAHRTRLSTETRVAAVDASARRAFGHYWLLVGPFSALIRRLWLAEIRRTLG